MKILISKKANERFNKLSLKSKNSVMRVIKSFQKGNVSKLNKLRGTNLYYALTKTYAPIFTKENGHILIFLDILTKKELLKEIGNAKYGD